MSRSTYMLMALAPPAASVPPTSVTSIERERRPAALGEHHRRDRRDQQQLDDPRLGQGDVGADDRARRALGAVRPLQRTARRQPGRDEGAAADGHSEPQGTAGRPSRPSNARPPGRCRRPAMVVEWPCDARRLAVLDVPEVDDDDAPRTGRGSCIVWNDPINLMSYVTFVLQKLFGYALEKATALMLDVHQKGRAVVASGTREQAEMHVFRLHEHGLWATLEHDE